MIKAVVILFFALVIPKLSCSQTMQEIFKALPSSYIFDLTESAKDSLLQYETYTDPESDSDETMKYSLEIDSINHYIQIEFYFTTGQNAFSDVEMRKFTRTDGTVIVVYSKDGGMERAYDEQGLIVFDYKNHKLKANKTISLPSTIEAEAFLNNNVPESERKNYVSYISTGYDLNPEDEKNSIEYTAFAQIDPDKAWMITDAFVYTWNGEKFILSKK